VCVVDEDGRIAREAEVASEPEALATWLGGLGLPLARVGLETGALAGWLAEEMTELGVPGVVCMDARHARAAMVAMTHKTDRNDARGLAQMLRTGWFRQVHVKARRSQPTQQISPGVSPASKRRGRPSRTGGGAQTSGTKTFRAYSKYTHILLIYYYVSSIDCSDSITINGRTRAGQSRKTSPGRTAVPRPPPTGDRDEVVLARRPRAQPHGRRRDAEPAAAHA
jgi:hypothetical protein